MVTLLVIFGLSSSPGAPQLQQEAEAPATPSTHSSRVAPSSQWQKALRLSAPGTYSRV